MDNDTASLPQPSPPPESPEIEPQPPLEETEVPEEIPPEIPKKPAELPQTPGDLEKEVGKRGMPKEEVPVEEITPQEKPESEKQPPKDESVETLFDHLEELYNQVQGYKEDNLAKEEVVDKIRDEVISSLSLGEYLKDNRFIEELTRLAYDSSTPEGFKAALQTESHEDLFNHLKTQIKEKSGEK